jgi:hypothetical protein
MKAVTASQWQNKIVEKARRTMMERNVWGGPSIMVWGGI